MKSIRTDPTIHAPPCGCFTTCGDLEEREDDPRAVCRSLPMPPKEPPVRIVGARVARREGTQ